MRVLLHVVLTDEICVKTILWNDGGDLKPKPRDVT